MDRRTSSPDLARFALDMLAIPPMSDEAERVFSAAKLLISDQRSQLQMRIIEANECLRHWYGPPTKGSFPHNPIAFEQGQGDVTWKEVRDFQGSDTEEDEDDDEDDLIRDDELGGNFDRGFIPGESLGTSDEEDV
jgi:hAT family C-terminal dimerisation region